MDMSYEKFERQKADTTQRFYIDYFDERQAKERGYHDSYYAVMDRSTGEEIGRVGGESEDQVLVCDWQWVCEALNRITNEIKPIKTEDDYQKAIKQLDVLWPTKDQFNADRLDILVTLIEAYENK